MRNRRSSHREVTLVLRKIFCRCFWRVFSRAEGLGDLVVVAVLEDLFGDLKFSGSEMVVGFQVAEGLLKAVGLRLLVGNLVEDCI